LYTRKPVAGRQSKKISRVVEVGAVPPGLMFAKLTEEQAKFISWIHPADPNCKAQQQLAVLKGYHVPID
jgi:hypothetical protein